MGRRLSVIPGEPYDIMTPRKGELMPNFANRARPFVAFQVRLSPELKERLVQYAYRSGRSQIDVLTTALERYLAEVDPNPPPEPTSDTH